MDQDLSQVKYVVNEICDYTSSYIDLCRYIFCLQLHTAVFPDRNDIETSQYIAIRCVNVVSPLTPMYRRGCKVPDERAEFIVKPYDSYDNEQSPVMARKPRVYRVPRRVEDKVYPILDQHLAVGTYMPSLKT